MNLDFLGINQTPSVFFEVCMCAHVYVDVFFVVMLLPVDVIDDFYVRLTASSA